jgi:hypothetical protein
MCNRTECDRFVSFDARVRVREHLHKLDMSKVEKQSTWYSLRELQGIRTELRKQRREAQNDRYGTMKHELFTMEDSRIKIGPANEIQRRMFDLAIAIRSSPESFPASFSVRKMQTKPAHDELHRLNEAMLEVLPTSPVMKNRKHRYLRKPTI